MRSIACSASFKRRLSCPEFEELEGVERIVDAAGPAARFPVFDMAARCRRLVNRLAQARGENLFVGAVAGRRNLEVAEQSRIALGKFDDHRNENSVRLIFEVGADARERPGAFRCGVRVDVVRSKRGRHHVLAEAVIVEGGTVTLALDGFALAEEIDAVVFRSRDFRQHPPGFAGEDLHPAVSMVGLAPGESASREPLQSRDVETLGLFGRHAAARLPIDLRMRL